MLPAMSQAFAAQACDDHVECFIEDLARVHERNPIVGQFERRHPAAHTDFEPAAAQMIEHADFVDEPQRIVKRQ